MLIIACSGFFFPCGSIPPAQCETGTTKDCGTQQRCWSQSACIQPAPANVSNSGDPIGNSAAGSPSGSRATGRLAATRAEAAGAQPTPDCAMVARREQLPAVAMGYPAPRRNAPRRPEPARAHRKSLTSSLAGRHLRLGLQLTPKALFQLVFLRSDRLNRPSRSGCLGEAVGHSLLPSQARVPSAIGPRSCVHNFQQIGASSLHTKRTRLQHAAGVRIPANVNSVHDQSEYAA